ncbi:MAG: Ig-like domain-containing protein [Vicinamibacterales bacterium]
MPSPSNSVDSGARQATATATKSDGSTEDVTRTATWQSSNASVATVSSSGRVNALTPGTSTISAAVGGGTGQLNLEVRAVDNVQQVSLRLTSIVINGTCDGNNPFEDSGDGEFSFSFTVTRDGGTTTVWSTDRAAFTAGSHPLSQGQTFQRNVTRGEDFLLEFRATEYDGLLGADSRMNDRFTNRSYVYSGGQWGTARSMALGDSNCGATVNYSISSSRQ